MGGDIASLIGKVAAEGVFFSFYPEYVALLLRNYLVRGAGEVETLPACNYAAGAVARKEIVSFSAQRAWRCCEEVI